MINTDKLREEFYLAVGAASPKGMNGKDVADWWINKMKKQEQILVEKMETSKESKPKYPIVTEIEKLIYARSKGFNEGLQAAITIVKE